jgi:glycosyltransferase involved in cell wall biosynthesis
MPVLSPVLESRPLVSVILPTHNMARFLGVALETVLKQTYGHLEVHVIDDGSTDNPREAIASLLTDPRVHYYSIPQSASRNRGGLQ